MKKPKSITVLGNRVTVKSVADLKATDGDKCFGLACVQTRTISIDSKCKGAAYDRVLRHEIFHMKLGLSGQSENLTDEQEEALAVLAEID